MRKRFNTTQSDLLKYNNTSVEVIGECDESKYDKADVGTMYDIRLYDGKLIEAFEDELEDL